MNTAVLHPVMFRALWNFRGFVFGAVRRDFQARYLGSLLGGVWSVLNPLAMILVFTLIFSRLMGAHLPDNRGGAFGYSIYLCAGLLPWNLFAELVAKLNTVFVENGNLMKKANFPRICLPTIVLLSSAVHFLITFALFFAFLAVVGAVPGWPLLALPVVLGIVVALALGLGLLLGTFNVFFRDVAQFTGVLLQFWLWLTPIIYLIDVLPPVVRSAVALNPMTPLVGALHAIFVQNSFPDWVALLYPGVLAVCLLGFGGLSFLRLSGEIVDEL